MSMRIGSGSGQWMRYQVQERKVLVLLSDPSFPWHINIACNHFGYILHFNLDAQGGARGYCD